MSTVNVLVGLVVALLFGASTCLGLIDRVPRLHLAETGKRLPPLANDEMMGRIHGSEGTHFCTEHSAAHDRGRAAAFALAAGFLAFSGFLHESLFH